MKWLIYILAQAPYLVRCQRCTISDMALGGLAFSIYLTHPTNRDTHINMCTLLCSNTYVVISTEHTHMHTFSKPSQELVFGTSLPPEFTWGFVSLSSHNERASHGFLRRVPRSLPSPPVEQGALGHLSRAAESQDWCVWEETKAFFAQRKFPSHRCSQVPGSAEAEPASASML